MSSTHRLGMVLALALASSAIAQKSPKTKADTGRYTPVPVDIAKVPTLRVTTLGDVLDGPNYGNRDCDIVSSHTDADFGGGSYVIQAGFAETEIAAASYVLPSTAFPLKIEMMEVIVATSNATVATTTEWTIQVYDGTPGTGILVAEFSSDGTILPHIQLPPGTSGVNLQLIVDPGDPDQIYIYNDSGTNTISFGFRIDKHNNQTSDPCFTPPPTSSNAFPATDTSGVASPSGNWLRAIDCGPFGCRAGWSRFNQLGACEPSGDWVMRMTWSSADCQPGIGACCLPDGSCQMLIETDCTSLGGSFQGDGTDCGSTNCAQAPQACCFPATGGCLDLTPDDCVLANGIPGGTGTTCATHICFPIGACCLPDGSCTDGISPDNCAALGGDFQGDGTDCGTITCPDPQGACCFPTGGCLVLSEADCTTAGGQWAGMGTDCNDADQNGTADACEACPADFDGDGEVNSQDFIGYLNAFVVGDSAADFDGDGEVNSQDFIGYLNAFVAGC